MSKNERGSDTLEYEEPDRSKRLYWLRIALAMLFLQFLLAVVAVWLGWVLLGMTIGVGGMVGCLLFLRYGPYAKRR